MLGVWRRSTRLFDDYWLGVYQENRPNVVFFTYIWAIFYRILPKSMILGVYLGKNA